VHHVPESEEYEGEYEAVTMMGVPHNGSVTGRDCDSAECALSPLLDELRAFGFEGRVAVEEATQIGRIESYEIPASHR